MNNDYILVNKNWLQQLEKHAQDTSNDIDNSPDLDDLSKARVHLLNSTLYGFISSTPTIIEQGAQLSAIQNDRLATYKQTVDDTLEQMKEIRNLLQPDEISAVPTMPPIGMIDALNDPANNETGKEIGHATNPENTPKAD